MTGSWQLNRERPLVALVGSLPVVTVALEEAIDFADVRSFDEAHGDVLDLFQQLRPDAIVVESAAAAGVAEAYTSVAGSVPVVFLSTQEGLVRVLGPDGWVDIDSGGDPKPGTIRNVLAGALFAAGTVVS
jgi:hypothetical protein